MTKPACDFAAAQKAELLRLIPQPPHLACQFGMEDERTQIRDCDTAEASGKLQRLVDRATLDA